MNKVFHSLTYGDTVIRCFDCFVLLCIRVYYIKASLYTPCFNLTLIASSLDCGQKDINCVLLLLSRRARIQYCDGSSNKKNKSTWHYKNKRLIYEHTYIILCIWNVHNTMGSFPIRKSFICVHKPLYFKLGAYLY